MSLPDATTTIRIERPPADEDPTEASGVPAPVAAGIRAHFSGPVTTAGAGGRQVSTWSLFTDPVDLRDGDTAIDEGSETAYAVQWAVARDDDGELDHVRASVTLLGPVP